MLDAYRGTIAPKYSAVESQMNGMELHKDERIDRAQIADVDRFDSYNC